MISSEGRLSLCRSEAHWFRNDAPSGLTIFVGNLKGLRVLDTFSPTATGVQVSSNSSKTIPTERQAYVSFGAGMSTQQINQAILPWNLFTLGAAHGNMTTYLCRLLI
jgi:hypothetical protein